MTMPVFPCDTAAEYEQGKSDALIFDWLKEPFAFQMPECHVCKAAYLRGWAAGVAERKHDETSPQTS